MAPGYNRTNNIHLNNVPPMSTSMPHEYRPTIQTPTTNPFPPPPPVPPRFPAEGYTGYNTGYNAGYNTGYNSYRPLGPSYLSNGYGNIGSYRNYSGYSYPGNQMLYHDMSMHNNHGLFGYGNVVNSFQQYVEETTRPVVNVVESILNTFASITAVVESTHYGLLNSFRAYEALIDNTGRMRSTFGQLLSTFSLIRLLKWIYNKLLALFGKEKQDTLNEILWQNSMSQIRNEGEGRTTIVTWHTSFLFIIIFTIIPYLILKIMSNVRQIQIQVNNPKSWLKSRYPVKVAHALYDFASVSNDELNLTTGQKIWIAPQSLQSKNTSGWLMATDGKTVGLVPNNYIQITGQVRKSDSVSDETVIAPQKVVQNANTSKQMMESDNSTCEDMISESTS